MKPLLFIFSLFCLIGLGPLSYATDGDSNNNLDADQTNWIDSEAKAIVTQAHNLDEKVLKLSLHAYLKARKEGKDSKGLLTVVDYSKPSAERRLWVIDVKNQKVLFNTWVAHGKNSGRIKATSFSNEMHSLKSSLGVFVTTDTYFGKDGYSLKVEGLEPGINDNAERRKVVIHGAAYAGGDVARSQGRLGCSWGCLAVGQETVKPLVDTIKNDTVVVAYYPDQNWLKQSSFVNYEAV